MLEIKEVSVPGYERVVEAIDPATQLHCFIAIHDSTLGPALGGIRMYPYANRDAALTDVLRLAKGMTYKSAIAEDGLGGGKSVIIANPTLDKSDALLLSFAEVVNYLQGRYIAAEDVGTSPLDMLVLRRKTPYVVALPTEKSSGDPSHYTAWGVLCGHHAVAQQLWNDPSLAKKRVAIQGLGHVGSKLAYWLFWQGAKLIITDVDESLAEKAAVRYGADIVSTEEIYGVECDIFCPCAMGGVINPDTLPQLKCRAVAGAANNQLATPELGKELMKRGILYAPDFIINSGGIINVSVELEPNGYDPEIARDRVNCIYDRLLHLFHTAEEQSKSTSEVADAIAEHNLKHSIGKRKQPIRFT